MIDYLYYKLRAIDKKVWVFLYMESHTHSERRTKNEGGEINGFFFSKKKKKPAAKTRYGIKSWWWGILVIF